jgi:predicted amidophosphoribosyltransferase
MKKCKKCHRQISIMEEYCSECLKNLSLREKFIEALRKEHFFQSGSTNRSLGNFCEYLIRTGGKND